MRERWPTPCALDPGGDPAISMTANTFGKPSLNIGQDLYLPDGQLFTWLELRQPPNGGGKARTMK